MLDLIKRIARKLNPTHEQPRNPSPTKDQDTIYPNITPDEREIIKFVQPFTMTSHERILSLIDAVRYLTQNNIPGSFVECGVWKGGSAMAAALTLLKAGDTSRDLHLFDTFTGMPPPTEIDRGPDGTSAASQLEATPIGTGIWCLADLEQTRANLRSTGYPVEKIHFAQGLVEETIPARAPETIALLRLDTDWYESTRHELVHLFPRLTRGGVLIIDDYGHWDGARRAVDEYITAHNIRLFLNRIDYTGRIAVKS